MASAFPRHIHYCLLALMLVIMRVADAHAHLCADGEEPPASIHLGDGGAHPCDDEQPDDHPSDKNVQLGHDGLLKKASSLGDLPMPAFLAFAFEFDVRHHEVVLVEPPTIRVDAAPHLRPPLRGPPV